MKLYVEAIFNSLDGEVNGFLGAGQLCTFIRLKGCNLDCSFCDTAYAQNVTADDVKMDFDEIMSWPDMLDKITLTGGEPLAQNDAFELIDDLRRSGKLITVETNGSIMIPPTIQNNIKYVVDYKLPSSGMEDRMVSEVFAGLRHDDIVKFVIADFDDYYVARGLATSNSWSRARKVFSPAISDQNSYIGWPAALAQMMIKDAKVLGDVQFSLQIHKILWPNAKVER